MNEVTKFMFYLFNRWDKSEAIQIFGDNLGRHIYGKWLWCRENGADQLVWYAELDRECQNKLVARANEIYKDN